MNNLTKKQVLEILSNAIVEHNLTAEELEDVITVGLQMRVRQRAFDLEMEIMREVQRNGHMRVPAPPWGYGSTLRFR